MISVQIQTQSHRMACTDVSTKPWRPAPSPLTNRFSMFRSGNSWALFQRHLDKLPNTEGVALCLYLTDKSLIRENIFRLQGPMLYKQFEAIPNPVKNDTILPEDLKRLLYLPL